MSTKELFVWVVILLLVVDVCGFVMWGLSGQIPPDGFYAGVISKSIINLFI